MKKQLFCLLLLLSGCARTNQEVWEDTKTAGRYLNKGFSTFFKGGRKTSHHSDYELALDPYNEQKQQQQPVLVEQSGKITPVKTTVADIVQDKGLPGIEGFHLPSGELQTLFSNVYFPTDSYKIEGDPQLKSLKKVAQYLSLHPKTYVFIEGHTDERGPAAYNLALGSRRANAVRSYLIGLGISSDQILTTSYGKEKPVAYGHEESAWKKNRRSMFKIYEK